MGEGGGPQAEPQQYPWRHSLIPTAVLTGGRPAILKLVRETLQLSAHTAAIHNRAPPPLPGLARQLALAWLTLAAAETLGLPAAPRTT